MRSVFLPDGCRPSGAGRHPGSTAAIALVLGAWCVGGLLLSPADLPLADGRTVSTREHAAGRSAGARHVGTRAIGLRDLADLPRGWRWAWLIVLAAPTGWTSAAPGPRRARLLFALARLVRGARARRCAAGRPTAAGSCYMAGLIAAVPARDRPLSATTRLPAVRALRPGWRCCERLAPARSLADAWRSASRRRGCLRGGHADASLARAARRRRRSASRCCSGSGSIRHHRAEPAAGRADRRAGRRPGTSSPGCQPRGRRAGRAGAAGPGDPRHPRPGVHQLVMLVEAGRVRVDTDPAAARRRLAAGRRDRPGEPGRGPGAGRRAHPGRPAGGAAAGGAAAGWWTGSAPRPALPATVDRDRRAARRCRPTSRGGAAAGGPGGAGQRAQARRRRRAVADRAAATRTGDGGARRAPTTAPASTRPRCRRVRAGRDAPAGWRRSAARSWSTARRAAAPRCEVRIAVTA